LPAPLARALALLVLGHAGGSCTPRGSIRFTRDPRGTRHSAPPQQAQDTTDLFLGRGTGAGLSGSPQPIASGTAWANGPQGRRAPGAHPPRSAVPATGGSLSPTEWG
jgi:hypothetical protein